jgi:hypothetical protein
MTGFMHTPSNSSPGIMTSFAEAEIIFVCLALLLLAWIYVVPRLQPVAAEPKNFDQIASPPTNTCPENGLCSSLVCTNALSPVKPRRRSVTPAAIQICV